MMRTAIAGRVAVPTGPRLWGCKVVVHQIRSSQNGAMVEPQLVVVVVVVAWYKMA